MSNLIELGPGAGSKVEALKASSAHLRGTIAQALGDETLSFGDDDAQLLKFHGTYQQEDRDQHQARKAEGNEKAHQFMVRTRIPGGVLSAAQYLAHDAIAERYANGTLRVTTRQGLQLHGVLKGDLRAAIHDVNASLLSTLAACGDVNRNVMACPAPLADRATAQVQAIAHRIAMHLAPRSQAYHEIWIDGERIETESSPAAGDHEPIYGTTYLPRKFKIGVALPNDNCVDAFTQDVALVADLKDERLAGFTVLVGGGMGMTHGKTETHPRLATPLCFTLPDDALGVVEAIVTVQRDYGNRVNRKQARMKYLVEQRGIGWFRAEVERRLGRPLSPPRLVHFAGVDDHLGWHESHDGRWFLGLYVESGRIVDREPARLRSALRGIVARFGTGVHLTGQQNVLLTGLAIHDRAAVDRELAAHGISADPSALDVRRDAMACPALPTCGLALTDAERVLPSIVERFAAELAALGIGERRLSVRVTGCPNGCARPYMGDIGIVGRSKDLYDVFIGGDQANTRLNWLYRAAIRREALGAVVAPLLRGWRDDGEPNENFGDYCNRLGKDALLRRAQGEAG